MRIAPMFGLPLLALLLCGGPVATTGASAQVRAAQPDAYHAWRAGPYAGKRIRCAGSAMCAWKRIPDQDESAFPRGPTRRREGLLDFLRDLPPELQRRLPQNLQLELQLPQELQFELQRLVPQQR
jgi:hypothetical protein